MNPNSDTQDNVETTATENTGDERQEHKEQPGTDTQEPEQEKTEQEQEEKKQEEEKQSRAQKRIQKLARERAEAAAEAQRLREELESYKSGKKATSELPKVEDFESYEDFQQAQQEFFIKQAEDRVLAKLQQENSQKTQVEAQAQMNAAIEELASEGIDINAYAEKVNEMPPLPVTLDQFGLSVKETLLLAKDLIDDPDTYLELSEMTPIQAAVKIGQMIAQKQAKSAAPKIPNAPKPIKPTSANAPVKRSEDSMSDEEFLAKRRAERLKG